MSHRAPGVAWTALVRAAIIGTQRQPPPAFASGEDWDALLTGGDDDAETAILRAASVFGMLRRAGRAAPPPAAELPEPAGPETRRRCAPAAAADLDRILARQTQLLPEWLALADRANVRVFEEQVPALFAYGAARPDLHSRVNAVAGARGAWLGRQFPEWRFAAVPDDDAEERWRHGDRAARLTAFVTLRRREPTGMRERLAAAWEREQPRERAAFVRALETQLSDDDEPFLESLLDDRRQDVREAAAALLARLPASAYARRAAAAAHAFITIRRGLLRAPILDVTLPEAPPAALRRDALNLKPPTGIGERAWLLREIVARTPPHELLADVAPATFLDLVRKSEHAPALLSGLAAATASSGDERLRVAWLEALASAPDIFAHAYAANINAPWSDARRDAIARLLERDEPRAGELALTLPGPWDLTLSLAFLRQARRAVAGVAEPHVWRARSEVYTQAALRVDPAIADRSEEWPAAAAQEIARDVIDAFYETVRFRAALRRHLDGGL